MHRLATTGGAFSRMELLALIVGIAAAGSAPPLAAQAQLVADLNTAGIAAVGFQSFGTEAAMLGSQLYVFIADDSVSGREPWVLDLATGNAERLADIYPGPTGSAPRSLTPIGTSLLFVATDPTSGEELWVTDGTAAGTSLVADIAPGAVGSTPTAFALAAGSLLFGASDGVSGAELWKWSGGVASLVADIEPGAGGAAATSSSPPTTTPSARSSSASRARRLLSRSSTTPGSPISPPSS